MSPTTSAFTTLLTGFFATIVLWTAMHPQPKVVVAEACQPTGTRIDINLADAATLSLLPGVGQGIAENIISAREQGIVFHNADELQSVKLIGPTLIRRIDPWVVYVGPCPVTSNTACEHGP